MRVAVVSDIHGNLHALEAVLAALETERPDELWCLGDLVGYGARPTECCNAIAVRASIGLAGNHDLAVRGTIDLAEFSGDAGAAAAWTRTVLSDEAHAYLDGLEPQGKRADVALFHASARDPVWEYVLSALLAELCLDEQRDRICLIGHSHVALSFVRHSGELATGEPQRDGTELDIAVGEWLLNPGSVGQPRDGDPRASWLLLDLDGLTACFHRASYDVAGAAAAIRAARLPDSLAERLEYGQ
jgi:predicted phosphodiesterase